MSKYTKTKKAVHIANKNKYKIGIPASKMGLLKICKKGKLSNTKNSADKNINLLVSELLFITGKPCIKEKQFEL